MALASVSARLWTGKSERFDICLYCNNQNRKKRYCFAPGVSMMFETSCLSFFGSDEAHSPPPFIIITITDYSTTLPFIKLERSEILWIYHCLFN